MSPETITLIIQAGIAGVFAVFAIVTTNSFLKFLEGERKQRASIMKDSQKVQVEMLTTLVAMTVVLNDLKEGFDEQRSKAPAPESTS